MAEWMSVAQAASLLHVSGRRVRELAEAGSLPADRLGANWLVDAEAVRSRAEHAPLAGRPLSPQVAWLMLAVVQKALDLSTRVGTASSSDGAGDAGASRSWANGGAKDNGAEGFEIFAPLSDVADRQARHRVRRLLAEQVPARRWESWLAGRAERRRVWVHPGVLDRLAADGRVHVGGVAAAAALGFGFGGGAVRRFYLGANDVDDVVAQFRLVDDPVGSVELMVVSEAGVEASAGLPVRPGPVPPAVALADLLESDDARERHAAVSKLEELALASG